MDVWVDGTLIFSEKDRFESTGKSQFRVFAHDSPIEVKSVAVKPATSSSK